MSVYNDERRKLVGSVGASRAKIESRLSAVGREIERAVDLAIIGVLRDREASVRLGELRAERDRLAVDLAAAAQALKVVTLHPHAIKEYLSAVERLDETLRISAAEAAPEAAQALRDLIETVTVHPPNESRAVQIECVAISPA